MSEPDPDAAAKILAHWVGYAWDGLSEGRIGDRGYPQWARNGIGSLGFQGGRQDLRDLAEKITKATPLRIARINYERGWNEAVSAAASLIESFPGSDIRLAAGEMTAQEMRTVKAVQRWLAS